MTEIKRTMIASLLIEQATELKGKRPSELGFEELVDVVQAVVKNCFIADVVLKEAESEVEFYCDGQDNNKDRCESQCLGCAGMQEIYSQ